MEKIHTSVEHVLRSCVTYIANETDYNLDVMLDLVTHYVHKDDRPSVQCEAIVLKGNRCTNSATKGVYCKKHVHFEPRQPSVRLQCSAFTATGERCVRDAKLDSQASHEGGLCVIHLGKQIRESRRPVSTPCVYYDEPDDQVIFCTRPCISGQWCCPYHRHLHGNYCAAFKCNNLLEYQEATASGGPKNKLLELRLNG